MSSNSTFIFTIALLNDVLDFLICKLQYAIKIKHANIFKHAKCMHPYTVTKGKPRHLAEVRLHASSLLVTHSQVKLSFAVVALRRGQETGEGRLVVAGSRALQT